MYKQKEVCLAHRFGGQMIKIRHAHVNLVTEHHGRLHANESMGKGERSHDNPGSSREWGAPVLLFYNSHFRELARVLQELH